MGVADVDCLEDRVCKRLILSLSARTAFVNPSCKCSRSNTRFSLPLYGWPSVQFSSAISVQFTPAANNGRRPVRKRERSGKVES